MFEDEHIKKIEEQEKFLAQSKDIAKTHDVLMDQNEILIQMKNEHLPEVLRQTEEIVGLIENGFNVEKLEKQARNVLNNVINKSDYTTLRTHVETSAQSLENAIDKAVGTSTVWKAQFESYKINGLWNERLIFMGMGIAIGFGSACFFVRKIIHLFM